ncbi:MAG TPA: PQQ-binding-like beta-propeller repeat protein [Thermoleophilaceae bacterium]
MRNWSRRRRWLTIGGGVLLVLAVGLLVAYLTVGQRPGDITNPDVEFTTPPKQPEQKQEQARRKGKPFAWPVYGFDAQRTHWLDPPNHLARPPFRRAWTLGGSHLIEFQPVLAKNTLYFQKNNGEAYAVNALTGKVRWRKHIARLAASSPAVSGKRAFFTTLSGRIVALNTKNGRILWARNLGSRSESSPLVIGDKLYFGSESGEVYGMRQRDGRVLWTYQAGGDVTAGPAYSNGLLYFGDYGGNMQAVRRTNGHLVWKTHTSGLPLGRSGGFYATPAVAFGRVYAGNLDRKVYSFSARSGKIAWSHTTGAYVYAATAVADADGSPPSVYVGSYDGHFYALDARSGRQRWVYNANGHISGAATVVGNIAYFSNLSAHSTTGLDVRSGRPVFKIGRGAYNPVISDGQRLWLTGYSSVYMLESKAFLRAQARKRAHRHLTPAQKRKAAKRRQAARKRAARKRELQAKRRAAARKRAQRRQICTRGPNGTVVCRYYGRKLSCRVHGRHLHCRGVQHRLVCRRSHGRLTCHRDTTHRRRSNR